MDKLIKFLNLLHSFTYIPVYYYQEQSCTNCIPLAAADYLPPNKYIQQFKENSEPFSYLMTDFYSLYGYVFIEETDTFLILGPVSSIPYSPDILNSMRREFFISETDKETFFAYFRSLPHKEFQDFIAFLTFVNYQIMHEEMIPIDILRQNHITARQVKKDYVTKQAEDKELNYINNSLEIEQQFINYIINGNTSALIDLKRVSMEIKVGILADTNLRHTKNTIIITISVYCRAAIKGGLPSDIAFHLSDAYIHQIESCTSIESIYEIGIEALTDYTSRVAERIIPPSNTPCIYQAIKFVHQNTNNHITVTDVAEHLGLSQPYLSHKFKSELGLSLNTFIYRCKLEEAKELLRYTDKSISEISNYLCFSSQSHFQTSFKKQYGITPQQYRHGISIG